MTTTHRTAHEMRVYPLDPQELTQEQIAVIFAMTSRSPEAFDEIKERVTEAKAADFNEKWVVGYGHASVAEHAVIHMAVENISRLACDELEDNRLASFTEKSSRYQVLERGSYHVPAELRGHELERTFTETCDFLFETYHALLEKTQAYLKSQHPQREGERDGAYNLRIRREATDSCRFVLPAATLTNVGVTMNARSLEHAITKLLSSELAESREIGKRLRAEGRKIAPTLVKYAEDSEYFIGAQKNQWAFDRKRRERFWNSIEKESDNNGSQLSFDSLGTEVDVAQVKATLVYFDRSAVDRLVEALLYRVSGRPYKRVEYSVRRMSERQKTELIDMALSGLGDFDPPLRELENIDYLFELEMDYGAYREYKRHRMQTTLSQPLNARYGHLVPRLIERAGAGRLFREAIKKTDHAFRQVEKVHPSVARYLVTHAHMTRTLAKLNLRECYHLLKLRLSSQAHFTIQELARQMHRHIENVHPRLIRYIRLRDEAE